MLYLEEIIASLLYQMSGLDDLLHCLCSVLIQLTNGVVSMIQIIVQLKTDHKTPAMTQGLYQSEIEPQSLPIRISKMHKAIESP